MSQPIGEEQRLGARAIEIVVLAGFMRVLTPFFREAPESLWPRAVAIEHLEHAAWLHDCIKDMTGLGYAIAGKTRSNTLLVRK